MPNVADRWPWLTSTLLLLPLIAQYLFPYSLEQSLSFPIASTRVQYVELAMLLLLARHKRVSNALLCYFGVGMLTLSLGAAVVVRAPLETAIWGALEAFLPWVLLGMVPITDQHRRPLRLLVTALFMLLVAQLLLYAAGAMSYVEPLSRRAYGEFGRVATTIGSSTATGTVLFLLTLWAVDLWDGWRARLILASIGAFAVSTTFSRGPMLMALVTVVIVTAALFARARKVQMTMRRAATTAAVGVVLAFALHLVAVEIGLRDALVERYYEGTEDAGRLVRYDEAVDTFLANPLLGVGLGGYQARLRFYGTDVPAIGWTSPHNVYLLVAAEAGIIGAIAFVVGMTAIARAVVRRWEARPVALGLIVVFVIGMNTESLYLESQFGLLVSSMVGWFLRIRAVSSPYRQSI